MDGCRVTGHLEICLGTLTGAIQKPPSTSEPQLHEAQRLFTVAQTRLTKVLGEQSFIVFDDDPSLVSMTGVALPCQFSKDSRS